MSANGPPLEPHPKFLAWIENLLPDHLRARVSPDDVLQDVWLQTARHAATWERLCREQRRAWLRRSVLRRIISLSRVHRAGRRAVRRELPLPVSAVIDERRWRDREQWEQQEYWQQQLRRLAPTHRAVVELRIYHALPWEHVAQRLQISMPAAKRLYARALARLRELTQDTIDQTPASRS